MSKINPGRAPGECKHGQLARVCEICELQDRIERLKHAMKEAMYLLDQPEPRPHKAFSELLLALNPELPSALRARGEK
jgi:hypothetical protein